MEYIEVTGKTVDDALTNAYVQLGTTSDMVEYEVIEKGSAGILGLGRKDAIIKALEERRHAIFRHLGKEIPQLSRF